MFISQYIKFKYPELIKEWDQIRSRLKIILDDMALFCHQNGHEFIITDLMSEESEDKKLKRVSKSHSEGRAADIRVKNWPLDFRAKFKSYFEERYKGWAAVSKSTGQKNLIVIHDNNNGLHTHVQVAPYKEKI